MNKLHLTTILLALTTAILLCNDFRWVKATKQWTASGIASTEVFPLFGDDFRISYSTRKGGALKITLVDASPSGKRKADKVVVDTKHFATPDRKGFSGYRQAYLVVEGDPRGWVVTVDQYLDEIQEWRFKNYTEDDAFRKLAVWADQGAKEISFDAPIQPWRLTLAAAEAKREIFGQFQPCRLFHVVSRKPNPPIFAMESAIGFIALKLSHGHPTTGNPLS